MNAHDHVGDVKAVGCLICRLMGMPYDIADAHHLIENGRRVSDWATIPLCKEHHQGASGIHTLSASEFERRYKGMTPVKLLALTIQLVRTGR